MSIFHRHHWKTVKRDEINAYPLRHVSGTMPYKKTIVILQACEICGKEVFRKFEVSA